MKIRLNTLKRIHKGETPEVFFWISCSRNNWKTEEKLSKARGVLYAGYIASVGKFLLYLKKMNLDLIEWSYGCS